MKTQYHEYPLAKMVTPKFRQKPKLPKGYPGAKFARLAAAGMIGIRVRSHIKKNARLARSQVMNELAQLALGMKPHPLPDYRRSVRNMGIHDADPEDLGFYSCSRCKASIPIDEIVMTVSGKRSSLCETCRDENHKNRVHGQLARHAKKGETA